MAAREEVLAARRPAAKLRDSGAEADAAVSERLGCVVLPCCPSGGREVSAVLGGRKLTEHFICSSKGRLKEQVGRKLRWRRLQTSCIPGGPFPQTSGHTKQPKSKRNGPKGVSERLLCMTGRLWGWASRNAGRLSSRTGVSSPPVLLISPWFICVSADEAKCLS